jgi:hypothetical protein
MIEALAGNGRKIRRVIHQKDSSMQNVSWMTDSRALQYHSRISRRGKRFWREKILIDSTAIAMHGTHGFMTGGIRSFTLHL